MASIIDSKLRARRMAQLGGDTSSATGAGAQEAPMSRDDELAGSGLFDGVSAAVRLQMELIVRASASPATALPAIISLIVDGSPKKRAAIIAAIEGTDALREQWERTWAVLRR